MHGYVPLDPQSDVSQEHYAVIYSQRPTRKRFPAGCVEVVADAETAIQQAAQKDKSYAAKVIGPSKSSEGQYIYYLVNWLET